MFNGGDYDLTETVNIPFNTFSSDDPSASVTVTDLVAGDIYVHKDGVEGTPAGITVSLNVGSVNGNHLAILDLSDTTDPGHYVNGSRYQVRMEGVTIDGATVNAWIGTFSIGCMLRPTTAGRKFTVESDGMGHADVKEVGGTAQTANDNGADINAILADTNELQTDFVNDGRLDLLIDAVLADTNELQVDWKNGGRLDLLLDSVAGLSGSGAVTCNIYTKTEASDPLDGVEVWITSDEEGDVVVAGTTTSDAMGLTTFYLDVGTYYVWRQLAGYTFTNPQTLSVT